MLHSIAVRMLRAVSRSTTTIMLHSMAAIVRRHIIRIIFMERKIYNKLVRDHTPEIIQKDGGSPKTRILDDHEYKKLLRLKLLEEAGEVNAAKTAQELEKELSDVLEVIDAIIKNEALDSRAIAKLKIKRREERGGFDKRIYLISG